MIQSGLVTPKKREPWHCSHGQFHWPKMKEDVQAYVKTCHVCQVDKTEWKKEASLL